MKNIISICVRILVCAIVAALLFFTLCLVHEEHKAANDPTCPACKINCQVIDYVGSTNGYTYAIIECPRCGWVGQIKFSAAQGLKHK